MSSATPKKRVSKPKKTASHPTYQQMIKMAVQTLKERGGSSRAAILKYILQNYKVGDNLKSINSHLRMALKRGVASGFLKQVKGTGASGSFRLGDKATKAPKKAKKTVKKPKKKTVKKAKKPASPKKAAAAKPKKAKTPKKKASPKKPKVAKKPKTPKKARTPKKVVKKTPKKRASPKKAKA